MRRFAKQPTRFLLCFGTLVACSGRTGPPHSELATPAISLHEWRQKANFDEVAGHRVAYWQAGDSNDETLFLIHGFPSASWDWQQLWTPLAENYHVVTLDLLGYGYSDKPKDYEYTIAEQADLVMGIAERLGVKSYHLIAHDYGVTVAQEILARHQETEGFLLSVCLLNGGAFPETQNHPLAMKLLKGPLGPYVIRLQSRGLFDDRLAAVFGPRTQPTAEHLDGYWALLNEQQGVEVLPRVIRYIDERHVFRERWVGALLSANIPVGVIVGTEDELSGENMVGRYEELVENADVVRLAQIGHYPQLEAPDEVLAAHQQLQRTRVATPER